MGLQAGRGGNVGVMDGLGTDAGDLVDTVMALQGGLAARHDSPPSPRAFDEMGFPGPIVDAVYGPSTPPAGIFGVGVTHLADALRPAVFIMLEMLTAPIELAAGGAVPWRTPAQRLVSSYMEPSLPLSLAIVGLPTIRDHARVTRGDTITVSAACSTLGAPVTLSGRRPAYLTAGHGAPADAAVYMNNDQIGTVVFSSCREQAADSRPVADVAVIELGAGTIELPHGGPPIIRADTPAPQSVVALYKDGVVLRGRVFGLSSDFRPDSYAGWGEVMLCSPMSAPGYSGTVAVSEDDATAAVGHVVGGSEGYVTVVQQLQYQLDAAQVSLRV
jgi:hypothetical protein